MAFLQQNQAQRGQFENSIRTTIMDLLKQPAVDPASAASDPRAAAFRNARNREFNLGRAQVVEGNAYQGISPTSGGTESALERGRENVGQASSEFEANLIGEQLKERQQRLLQALQLGAGVLPADQEADIRRELSALDNQLREKLGFADIGLRRSLGGGQLGLGLLETLLGNQYNQDRLGFDYSRLQALLNAGIFDLF